MPQSPFVRILVLFFCVTSISPVMGQSNLQSISTTGNTPMGQVADTANYPYWVDMMQDPNANFFEVQRAFELYWENRPIEKGSGWKPFKRWESYWETRVLADGSFPPPDQVLNEYRAFASGAETVSGAETITGSWTELGPFDVPNGSRGTGRLNCITFHPTDSNIIFVGAPAGGLWRSNDGGQSWAPLTDTLATLGVSALIIDPTNTNIMYMGSGDRDAGDAPGLGVFKSTNGGVSWTSSNSGMGNRTVGMMAMHPTNSSILWAATNGGIYKTTNAGVSWTLSLSGAGNYKDLRLKPGDPSVVYASGSGEFYRSNDGGVTFTQIQAGIPNSQRLVIGVTPDDANYVYCLLSQSSTFYGLYLSTDAGLNFTLQSDTPNVLGYQPDGSDNGGQGWYDLCIAVDPADKQTVYTGGVNIWKSTNSGVNWNVSSHWYGAGGLPTVHADQHALEFSPVTGAFYSGNDGGIHRTYDGGASWSILSDGLAVAQIYKIGVSAQTRNLVINGYQDNGTAVYDGGTWRKELGGDGMECLIDPSDSNYQYAEIYFGRISRTHNNGQNWSVVANDGTNGITETGAWITPYILDNRDPNTMLVGYRNVWRSTNIKATGGIAFSKLSDNLAGSNSQTLRDLKQSSVNPEILYTARADNKMFRTDNLSDTMPTWINLSNWLPNNSRVLDIETHPTEANTVYICQSNRIYKSVNAGLGWINISGSLPNISMNCMVLDPYSHEGIYVGTDAGVYYRDSNMLDWVLFNNGLPTNIEVTELQIYHGANDPSASRLRAATYGRGLWESALYDPGNIAPLAFFQVSDTLTNLCDPDTLQLLDYSVHNPNTWNWSITPSTYNWVSGNNTSQSPKVEFTDPGWYTISLTVSNSYGNSSTTHVSEVRVSGGVTLPFVEDFETFPLCPGSCGNECDLPNEWYNWENTVADSMDWRTDEGSTGSPGTGPTMDFNPGTLSGNYLYTEASWCFSQLLIVESPCIDLRQTSNAELKFAYHMNGFSMGDLHVDALSNGAWQNNVMPAIIGNQGNNWIVDSASLVPYQGQSIKLRFRAETGPNYGSDIAIDDILITTGPFSAFTADDTTICPGDQVQFTDQSINDPTSWSWSVSPSTINYAGGTGPLSQHPLVQFQSPGLYTVSLTSSNTNGAHQHVQSQYILVTEPDATFSSNDSDNVICPFDTVIFSGIAGQDLYTFTVDGTVQQAGSNSIFSTASLTNGQSVGLVVTDSNGCAQVGTAITIQVLPAPVSNLTSSELDSALCEGDTVTFTESSGATNYLFKVDNQSAQIGSQNTYTTDSLQNGQQVSVTLLNPIGCAGIAPAWTMTVYPIPVAPQIQLLGNDSLEADVTGDSYQWWYQGSLLPFTGAVIPAQGVGDYEVLVVSNGCASETSSPFYFEWVGIGDAAANNGLILFPNPTNGGVTLQLERLPDDEIQLWLTDGLGRRVWESIEKGQAGQAWRSELALPKLAPGTYYLQVIAGDYQAQKRLLIQE